MVIQTNELKKVQDEDILRAKNYLQEELINQINFGTWLWEQITLTIKCGIYDNLIDDERWALLYFL